MFNRLVVVNNGANKKQNLKIFLPICVKHFIFLMLLPGSAQGGVFLWNIGSGVKYD